SRPTMARLHLRSHFIAHKRSRRKNNGVGSGCCDEVLRGCVMSRILAGKVALVTGGSRGIGAATARALADEGADVAISFTASGDKAERVLGELKQKGV